MDDIFEALALFVAAHSNGLPVAFQEVEFAPPESGIYIDATFLPNGLKFEGVAAGRLDQGLMQLSLVYPRANGLKKPFAAAQAIADHYPIGLRIGKIKVNRQTVVAAPLPDAHEIRVPITVSWTA